MLKELVEAQKKYTNHYFETLDLPAIEDLISLVSNCSGMLFLTGVGKSGFVAKKIAFTMVSTGTRAFYISPVDALHGDIGLVASNDLFLLFSKSGESEELLQLVPAIHQKGARAIAIVCSPNSRLAAVCNHSLILPCERELCPFDMAPTVSTANQLLFGDLLSVALMKRKEFSIEQYALNHPSGRLGKRASMRVRDVMLTGEKLPLCNEQTRIQDLLVELSSKRCGCVLVTDHASRLSGIFTDGDLRRCLQTHGAALLGMPIGDVMNRSPISAPPEMYAWEALKRMESIPHKRITVLPITQEGRLVGLLHLHDLVRIGL